MTRPTTDLASLSRTQAQYQRGLKAWREVAIRSATPEQVLRLYGTDPPPDLPAPPPLATAPPLPARAMRTPRRLGWLGMR